MSSALMSRWVTKRIGFPGDIVMPFSPNSRAMRLISTDSSNLANTMLVWMKSGLTEKPSSSFKPIARFLHCRGQL